jgi:hypothetical protein
MEGDMAVNLASCAGFVPGEWPLSIDDCAHCVHSRACHAPTREQRLQQHIAERDAFLAEDALSAASEPMVSISLKVADCLLSHILLTGSPEFLAAYNELRAAAVAAIASTHSQSEEG